MRKILALIVGFVLMTFSVSCSSKKGCIDPGSINYDPEAKIDDGNCVYPIFNVNPTKVIQLSNEFEENSGLKYSENRLWTFVDGNGNNKIFTVNFLDGSKMQEIELANVTSVNFEAISASTSHFFIGDFGNNNGNRDDLTIYKFPKPQPINGTNAVVAEKIKFIYPEQEDFSENSSTNFDCEAMFHYKDNLYLFTKNNEDKKTNLYRIPAFAGNYQAKLIGVFDVKGLVTDADISPDGKTFVLIGHHENLENFIWIFRNFPDLYFFLGQKTIAEIGSFNSIGQVEGISFINNDSIYISNEQYRLVPPTLYALGLTSIE